MRYKTPKYPRIIVSKERHAALAKEAKERRLTISELVETKLNNARPRK